MKANKSSIELKSTVLPPKYMDLFEKTTDYYQDILTKCKNKFYLSYKTTRRTTEKDYSQV